MRNTSRVLNKKCYRGRKDKVPAEKEGACVGRCIGIKVSFGGSKLSEWFRGAGACSSPESMDLDLIY